MKEDFFSKFKDYNYNKELEKILEKKDFSKDVKNLLLSMLYKLENSYNDYYIVKRKSKTKQEYLDNILENIKSCKKIELINQNNNSSVKKEKLYEVDVKSGHIKVFANEIAILAALNELNNFQIRPISEYNLIKNSMPYLLNMAYDMENIEMLRDFNAWSWNALVEEIKDININLIYQNLKIVLNMDLFSEAQNNDLDLITKIKQELYNLYDKQSVDAFIELIFKLSIMIYIKVNIDEKDRLAQEKNTIGENSYKINDKKAYVDSISQEKKKLTDELKKIDLIINNKELLLEEFERRNSKLPEYNKLFNLSHLVEKLQRERENVLNRIAIYNKKNDPQVYLDNKQKIEQDFKFLQDIEFEKENNIYKYIDELQTIFINNIFIPKINFLATREEIIDCVYELRYYNFLPYSTDRNIKDVEILKEYLEKAKEILIEKLYDNRIINTFSTNLNNDIEIVKNIFNLKIIDIEKIYIEIEKSKEKYIVRIYDEKETLENEVEMNLQFNKKDKIKLNRKVKLFKPER